MKTITIATVAFIMLTTNFKRLYKQHPGSDLSVEDGVLLNNKPITTSLLMMRGYLSAGGGPFVRTRPDNPIIPK
jgi:hypothetical protein